MFKKITLLMILLFIYIGCEISQEEKSAIVIDVYSDKAYLNALANAKKKKGYQPFATAPRLEQTRKAAYISLLNLVRSKGRYCGNRYYKAAPILYWNEKLYKSAYEHTYDMAGSGVFSHYGSNTISDWTAQVLHLLHPSFMTDRIRNNGYNYKYAAENIAKGFDSFEEVVDAWLKSPGHCANIMNPNLREFAVAKIAGYWTLEFGSR